MQCPQFPLATQERISDLSLSMSLSFLLPSVRFSPPLPLPSPSSKRLTEVGAFPPPPYPSPHAFVQAAVAFAVDFSVVVSSVVAAVVVGRRHSTTRGIIFSRHVNTLGISPKLLRIKVTWRTKSTVPIPDLLITVGTSSTSLYPSKNSPNLSPLMSTALHGRPHSFY